MSTFNPSNYCRHADSEKNDLDEQYKPDKRTEDALKDFEKRVKNFNKIFEDACNPKNIDWDKHVTI